MKITTKLWIGILLLTLLSPLGLILPEYFKAGSAWGEWDIFELNNLVGYIPEGLVKLATFWKAPIPDYAFKAQEEKGILNLSFSYIISAILGIAIIVVIVLLIGKKLIKKDD